MAINSVLVNGIYANVIPGYPAEMTILKAYIYAKPWVNGEGESYLTLFSMVPINEFQKEVPMFDHEGGKMPRTHGVFTRVIGSISGLVTTQARIGLRTYQDHLEQVGWQFKGTVPGVRGEAYETARKMAFAHIQKIKKQSVESSKVPFIKDIMKAHIDDIVEISNHHGNITAALEKLTALIDSL